MLKHAVKGGIIESYVFEIGTVFLLRGGFGAAGMFIRGDFFEKSILPSGKAVVRGDSSCVAAGSAGLL